MDYKTVAIIILLVIAVVLAVATYREVRRRKAVEKQIVELDRQSMIGSLLLQEPNHECHICGRKLTKVGEEWVCGRCRENDVPL